MFLSKRFLDVSFACLASMYLVYSMVFTATFVAMLPYFIYKAFRHGKYASSLKERLGFLPPGLGTDGPVVWLHAVSVGELLAARPLIESMSREISGVRLVVSTTTIAGQMLARGRMAEWSSVSDYGVQSHRQDNNREDQSLARPQGCQAGVFYFPFDWRFAAKRALDHIQPTAVVIMETEIWPNFLSECHRRRIPVMVANGRLSEQSFSRYRMARGFIRRVLDSVSLFLMQTQADRERVILLGADSDRVMVCGNLKYDAVELPAAPALVNQPLVSGEQSPSGSPRLSGPEDLHKILGLDSSERLIVAGSTASGEEEILLAAFRRITGTPELRDARLILAPRQPERFDDVAKKIADSGLVSNGEWVRRSAVGATNNGDCSVKDLSGTRIILLDSIGELGRIYQFASVVFIGGSLVPVGGHNIIEAALYAKPIMVGPYTHNFRQVVKDFAAAGALVQIAARDRQTQVDSLSAEIIRLLTDSAAARSVGARARQVVELNRGATARTMTAIRSIISQGLK